MAAALPGTAWDNTGGRVSLGMALLLRHQLTGASADLDSGVATLRQAADAPGAGAVTAAVRSQLGMALCRAAGIQAYGVGHDTWPMDHNTTGYGYFREFFASIKATGTLIFQPNPRFLGRKETGVQRALQS